MSEDHHNPDGTPMLPHPEVRDSKPIPDAAKLLEHWKRWHKAFESGDDVLAMLEFADLDKAFKEYEANER